VSFLGMLLIFIAIDFAITVVLSLFGTPSFVIDIIVSFVMAFLFSYFRHDKRSGPFIKSISFHRSFATVFIILLALSYVMGHLL